MSDLDTTADPRALVPGNAEAVRELSRAMTARAADLHDAANGLGAVGSPAGWRGRAADAFREQFDTRPAQWAQAGDAFTAAARALAVHAETLDWAQIQAAEAVRLWATGPGGQPAAIETLDRARSQLRAAGDDAALRVTGAADPAPLTPWGRVEAIADGAADVGREIVNAAASAGNAALHHPLEVGAMALGTGMIIAGAGGTAGGAAVTATGVGAPVGVPAAAASIGLVLSGAAVAGAGALSVAQSAAGPDRVSPAGSGAPAAPGPRPAAERPTVTDRSLDNIVGPLYRGTRSPGRTGDGTTADAVRHERATGLRVGDKTHTRKANEAVRALRNWLRRHPGASPTDRGVAQQEYDNLLDALGRTP